MGIPSNPLSAAVEHDDLMQVAVLLRQGHRPSPQDFCLAIELKSYSILELCLQAGYDINEAVGPDRPPALANALHDQELSKWLLERGADPNARCYYDFTPLTIAAGSASLELIELLFKHGASVEYGAPLHFAVRHQRPSDIIEFFLQKGASINALLFANHQRSWNHFTDALPLGTPLHEALQNRDKRTATLLMRHGADPRIRDNKGNPADVEGMCKL